ncbi:MAG: histidine kinase [Thiobacillaceae bacterium]|jgi:two-component system sensor histidine kinase AlgZ|nr:histidine kinase [Thiobacillaceae bacterium]
MPNGAAVTLPDFRNLGVLLRAALVAQLLGLGAALVKSADLAEAARTFLGMTAMLEPALLLALLALFFLSPWLRGQTYAQGAAVVMAVVVLCATLWNLFLRLRFPDADLGSIMRTVLLAGGASFVLLGYFNWRHRALSPALAEARLQALQSRIRPHFLFNSLNTVLSLLRSSPRQAEAVLENLADLFRVQMADNRQLSPLARELELARSYAHLEEMRLGERLKLVWKVDNAPQDALLPPLVLQPLLENAVYHGIEPSPEGGAVRVDVFAKDQRLNVVVRNPIQETTERRAGNRMALSNIRERLALHFDADARLTTHVAGGEFIVQVVMPLRRGTADAA